MTPAFNLNTIAQASAVQIVYCLVEGTLIAVFTASALGLSRRQNSVTRFAAWFSALMAIATLPFLAGSLWSHVGSQPQSAVTRSAITLPASWAVYLFGAWAAISGLHLVGIGRSLWHLRRLRKSCVVIDPTILDTRLQEAMTRNQSPRRIALCTSEIAHVPTAIGLVKPAIVIPKWVMQELSSDELNQILLHELAHLRRWDDWTNLAQKVVKALFFFHPAVWWIEQRVSLEREMACDEAVLAETASPRAYAECLAHLAEKTLIQRSIALAQAALGKIHQTSLRVSQILDTNRPSGTARSWKPAVSLVAAFALACVLGVARAPRLIAFSDTAASQLAADPTVADSTVNDASGDVMTGARIVNASAKLVGGHVVGAKLPTTKLVTSKPRTEHRGPLPTVPFLARPVSRQTQHLQSMMTQPAIHGHAETTTAQSVQDAAMVQTDAVEENMRAPGMFHLVNATAEPFAFTETLFVVIEGGESRSPGQPAFRIQLWRVMVLHPVVDPNSNRIPPKQT
jgi:beta-lactamase regulating signal transducer with metallopeptidase domain